MCIIASSAIGVNLPDDSIITRMWKKNPDGAGFMYNANGKVYISKGYMILADFNNALDNLKKEIDVVNTSVVLHFRIGTHGGNTPENTHPFPVTNTEGMLKKLKSTCSLGMAHNGIIHSVKPRNNISDTMEYVLEYLSPFKKLIPDFYKFPVMQKVIENGIDGSRMVFLNSAGELTYIGSWETDKETGIMYSNNGYKEYKYDYYGGYYGKYNYYDWYDDFGKTKPTLASRTMMFIDEGMLVSEDGEYEDAANDNYMLDSSGNVYRYDEYIELAVRITGTTAYTFSGVPMHYDDDNAIVMDWISDEEYESYIEDYYGENEFDNLTDCTDFIDDDCIGSVTLNK